MQLFWIIRVGVIEPEDPLNVEDGDRRVRLRERFKDSVLALEAATRQGGRQFLEDGKGKRTNSPLKLPERPRPR